MSEYVKSTNFASKDSLASGNPLKIVKGTEIDSEFNNIATAIATKADLNGPTFIGVPSAPTASAGTSTAQIATTAYADNAITAERTATATLTNKSLTTPTLTGVPVAPTAAVNTNTTQLATTAFVVAQIADDAPTKTGTGATGDWNINITGTAPITTAQVLTALASASVGAIGTYAWLITVPDATVNEGDVVLGSSLRYSGVYTDGAGNSGWPTGAAPSGSWRAMGRTLGGYGRTGTLFFRIS